MIDKMIEELKESAIEVADFGSYNYYVELSKMIEILEKYKEQGQKWISVDERLPTDDDNRYYLCITEITEEPMILQYCDCGFGIYNDIYDKHTLSFVDTEFKTNKELGLGEVIAWCPIPKYHFADVDKKVGDAE